jgi:hypothetical protein
MQDDGWHALVAVNRFLVAGRSLDVIYDTERASDKVGSDILVAI